MSLYRIHTPDSTSRRFESSPSVAIETDALNADALPALVRVTADAVSPETLTCWSAGKVPMGADGMVTWLAGEQILHGSPASIRHALRFPGRSTFVPVHYRCLDELPLVALQPRFLRGGTNHDYWDCSVRIAGCYPASQLAMDALHGISKPWAKLSLALLSELEAPGRGISALERMWETRQQSPSPFVPLVLRNLIALLILRKEIARAERFLEVGLLAYPAYAELCYIAAWLNIHENRAARAITYLERAKLGDRGFIGCGGESSYRADWLFGLVALRVGNELTAFDHFRRSIAADPAFSPAVEQLLQLRLPPRLVANNEKELQLAACHNPAFFERIFDFFLLHRAFELARQLLDTNWGRMDVVERLRQKLSSATAPFQPGRANENATSGVRFSGPFFEHSSLARINRELAASALSSPSLTVSLEPSAPASTFPRLFPNGELLEPAILRPVSSVRLTVRHQWPPDFRRPASGKLGVILPWEYGAVPRAWVRQIESNVDELWVPSRFVHDVLRRSGVMRTPIEVIPNGFDPAVFSPQGPISRPHGCRKFAFLFVGGAIRRKGIDLLLEAYRRAFDPGEDVTLITHISGLGGSYQHNSLTRSLQKMAADPHAPRIQILRDSLEDATLASLYRGCDVFLLPYRGEGFGMPLLEAMACGKPVITTSEGPAREFCDEESAFFVPAREEVVPDDPPPLGEFDGKFTWFEPDIGELGRTLRYAYEHPQEMVERGRLAASGVKKFTWERIRQQYRERIAQLMEVEKVASSDCVTEAFPA